MDSSFDDLGWLKNFEANYQNGMLRQKKFMGLGGCK
jgi:hypothetical protein